MTNYLSIRSLDPFRQINARARHQSNSVRDVSQRCWLAQD
jgi:hypothetical protein